MPMPERLHGCKGYRFGGNYGDARSYEGHVYFTLSQRKWAASPGKTREQSGAGSIVWHGSAVVHGRQPEKKADLPLHVSTYEKTGGRCRSWGQTRPSRAIGDMSPIPR
jgi:hypothetical protein